jgi:hypothetical protein
VAAAAPDPAEVQAGLRVVFGAGEQGLGDGIIGPVSRRHLQRLCETVPLPADEDAVAGTLEVARELAALERALPDWRPRLTGAALGSGPEALDDLLPLVGPAAVKRAVALPGSGRCTDLADIVPDPERSGTLRMGLNAVLARQGAAPLPSDATTEEMRDAMALACAAWPEGTGARDLVAAADRLGQVLARVPTATALLADPAFAAWLREAPTERMLRLLATPPAVALLLQEAEAALPAAPHVAEPLACAAPEGGLAYYSLTGDDLAALAARTGIAEALAPVAERRFDERAGLIAAINEALGTEAPHCAALAVETIVARHEAASRVHALDAAALQALAFDARLAPVTAALAPLVGLESDDRAQLAGRVEAAVRAVVVETVDADIVGAADAAAAAAEEVRAPRDVPTIPVPPDPAREPQAEFAITPPSLQLLRADVGDPEILDAIGAARFEQAAGRNVLRARVLDALEPIREARIAGTAAAALAAADAAIVARYRLVPAVTEALGSEPALAAISPDLVGRLAALEGAAYPTERLLARALATLDPPAEPVALQAVMDVGRKVVEDPIARRAVAPIAARDCGCVANRYEWDSLVYAFYPFWQFAKAGPEAGPPPTVDFELVERIAFDGLSIGADARLRYAPRWTEAAPTFTVSARRHQAKVDLAIRIRGWREWSSAQIEDAAFDVVEELTMRRAADPLVTSGGVFGWLDRYFDRRPDGVTLIVEDYTGLPGEPSARNLVAFVRAISAGLAGTGKTINLAFDIPLVGTPDREPLFRDLREVILPYDPLRPKMVEHVIVFLERPTAESKKVLRARVENAFTGEARIEVMRDIIPVVPPGGNAPLGHEEQGEMLVLASAGAPFGQFHHDVLYFQDNFRGIGFWPAPVAGAVLADGTPDRLTEIVRAEFDEWGLPRVLQPHAAQIDRVCTFVCPNRLAFYLASALAGGLVLATSALALYSRRLRAVSEGLWLVPVMTAGLAVMLLLVATCDRSAAVWAPLAITGLVALLTAIQVFHWYGRRLDGPMP